MLTLVIGGAASGKSAYAERLFCADAFLREPSGGGLVQGNIPKERPGFGTGLYYIATMQPFGKEAEERIRKHRAMRAGKGFEPIECPGGLRDLKLPRGSAESVGAAEPVGAAGPGGERPVEGKPVEGKPVEGKPMGGKPCALLEDLGNLCANELFSEEGEKEKNAPDRREQQAAERVVLGVAALKAQCGELVVVSNEVFSAGTDYAGDTEAYLRVLGEVNLRVAEMADKVVEVVAGIPVVHKTPDRRRDHSGPAEAVEACRRPHGMLKKNGDKTEEKNGDKTGEKTDGKSGEKDWEGSGMIFVTGPAYSGKRAAAAALLKMNPADIREYESIPELEIPMILKDLGAGNASPGDDTETEEKRFPSNPRAGAAEVQKLAALCGGPEERQDLEALAEKLCRFDVVTASETGCGVVPMDPEERRQREAAGRLACLLAARAKAVVRVFCGIPTVISGELPLHGCRIKREQR